jgi:hypothetical protein
MGDSTPCPTCGVYLLKPLWPSIASTTWSDECVCSDMVTCVSHQINGELPKRPGEEVLKARAEERYQAAQARYVEKLARFKASYPDDPAMDATDGAHPAWWRGHDYVSEKLLEIARAGEKKGEQYFELATRQLEINAELERALDQVALALGLAAKHEGRVIDRASIGQIIREACYVYEWREAVLDGLNWGQAEERAESRSNALDHKVSEDQGQG